MPRKGGGINLALEYIPPNHSNLPKYGSGIMKRKPMFGARLKNTK